MRVLLSIIVVSILLAAVWIIIGVLKVSSAPLVLLETGTFVVLTLTLIALIIYACDTHIIATMTKSQWQRDSIMTATYQMSMADPKEKSDKVMFQLTHTSNLIVRAKVQCNFKVYGECVTGQDEFCGKEIWYIFPLQSNQGWFKLSPLLSQKGKTIADMKKEYKPDNRHKQLTMDLKIQFRDELDNRRDLPTRSYFFDFKEWQWIPKLTKKDEWIA